MRNCRGDANCEGIRCTAPAQCANQ
jgi:hypothetical protein